MIYLDNAATTKVNPEVLEAMLPYFSQQFANPSAAHHFGLEAKKAVEKAREFCAELIGADPSEIVFTSGGTESDNTAIFSVPENRHIITSLTEHHAVLNPCKKIEELGRRVTFLSPSENGDVSASSIESALEEETALVSVMTANNEIGTITDIKAIGSLCRSGKILFHTDAVQAFGHIPIDVNDMNIDLLSASGHKLGAPKGVGLLYVRKGVRISPFLYGGGQEQGLRSGTLNVPSIIGLGEAARLSRIHMSERFRKETDLRDYLISRVLSEISGAKLNGSIVNRLPGNAHFSIPEVNGAEIMELLSGNEIFISTGSACSSSNSRPSHVLTAIGMSAADARSSIRVTLSYENTKEEIDIFIQKLKEYVDALRNLQ
ncbi:cysteine desulfurase family protein [Butyrivibrio sp. FC2001]|uniref:cysteine desulfurase family protein n=1 Tax=Butyrivibrio sp. FC2001 TaxID=1280671 RepID=UPI0004157AAE|nr:cysteine desulfurase family protein [Butyrivibrio sp. FC2001]